MDAHGFPTSSSNPIFEYLEARLLLNADFGDAPDPLYPTLLASNGARHMVDNVTFLGTLVDTETDGLQSPGADGDDLDNLPDEDGVTFLWSTVVGALTRVDVVASAPGFLDAWYDFNIDGDWNDPGEQVFVSTPLATGNNPLIFWCRSPPSADRVSPASASAPWAA